MLGADVAVIERLGFLAGEGEDLFHAGRVGDVAGHLGIRAGPDLFLHLNADGLEIEAEFLEHVDRDALAELDQPKEKVFGAHIIVVEAVGFLAGEGQHLLGAGSEVVHVLRFSLEDIVTEPGQIGRQRIEPPYYCIKFLEKVFADLPDFFMDIL